MKFYSNKATYHAMIHQNRRDLPNLIFFHGFMGSGKVFEPLIQLLLNSCNPITIDLIGHGETKTKPNPDRFTAELQVKDVLSILDRFQLKNLFVYGYSMGGRLAQHLYISDPSRFSGLILESTNCGITDDDERRDRKNVDEERAKDIETDFSAFVDRWIKLPLFKSPDGVADFDYESIIRSQNPQLMAASLRGFGSGVMPPVCDQLRNIQAPLGLLAGKADQKYVDMMREMAQLCSASELQIIDGAGHRVHVDQPEQTAKFITQFLNRHG